MRRRFFVRLYSDDDAILYVSLGETVQDDRKMQADDVLSRQAVFVRCCLITNVISFFFLVYHTPLTMSTKNRYILSLIFYFASESLRKDLYNS